MKLTVEDVLASIRRCWTGLGMAEREALCNRVKDDLERQLANPGGETPRYCECARGFYASDGCCNWCGRPVR